MRFDVDEGKIRDTSSLFSAEEPEIKKVSLIPEGEAEDKGKKAPASQKVVSLVDAVDTGAATETAAKPAAATTESAAKPAAAAAEATSKSTTATPVKKLLLLLLLLHQNLKLRRKLPSPED